MEINTIIDYDIDKDTNHYGAQPSMPSKVDRFAIIQANMPVLRHILLVVVLMLII